MAAPAFGSPGEASAGPVGVEDLATGRARRPLEDRRGPASEGRVGQFQEPPADRRGDLGGRDAGVLQRRRAAPAVQEGRPSRVSRTAPRSPGGWPFQPPSRTSADPPVVGPGHRPERGALDPGRDPGAEQPGQDRPIPLGPAQDPDRLDPPGLVGPVVRAPGPARPRSGSPQPAEGRRPARATGRGRPPRPAPRRPRTARRRTARPAASRRRPGAAPGRPARAGRAASANSGSTQASGGPSGPGLSNSPARIAPACGTGRAEDRRRGPGLVARPDRQPGQGPARPRVGRVAQRDRQGEPDLGVGVVDQARAGPRGPARRAADRPGRPRPPPGGPAGGRRSRASAIVSGSSPPRFRSVQSAWTRAFGPGARPGREPERPDGGRVPAMGQEPLRRVALPAVRAVERGDEPGGVEPVEPGDRPGAAPTGTTR